MRDLFNSVQQPTPWTMAAMISRRKGCLRSVFSLEHSGRMRRACHCFRRKILWNFSLAASARFAVMHKIVADLGRDHDFIPLVRERLCDQFFAETISVCIGRIEQSDAEIECPVYERNRFALGEISPPTCRNRPHAETDFA